MKPLKVYRNRELSISTQIQLAFYGDYKAKIYWLYIVQNVAYYKESLLNRNCFDM